MQQPQPPSFAEVAWEKMRARPAKFSWGDPIPGLWDVPGYPELTTPQLEQIMKNRGIGDGETDECNCIDCGGDQPSHSPNCEYMVTPWA
jgi:hypothetical protein